MNVVTIVGALAAVCSTLSFVPQAWKIIRSGKTEDISAPTYALTVAGFILWFSYGILRGDGPLIATNAIAGLLSAFILTMTLFPALARRISPNSN